MLFEPDMSSHLCFTLVLYFTLFYALVLLANKDDENDVSAVN